MEEDTMNYKNVSPPFATFMACKGNNHYLYVPPGIFKFSTCFSVL